MNNQCLYVACSRCGQILKELTKEEINKIAQEHGVIVDAGVYEFAKAILKKAQE
jgi:hypothetical protein